MIVKKVERRIYINVLVREYVKHLCGRELLVRVIGYALDRVSNSLAHLGRKHVTKIMLEQISYAALAGLRIDADNVGLVFSSNVLRIDRKIRNGPIAAGVILAPLHSLCDSILM